MSVSHQSDEQTRAPEVPGAFPVGDTESGLKQIRTRLLDLTNRNKLLNFRFPARSVSYLRVVDVNLEDVYGHLTDERNGGRSLHFVAVPEPPSSRLSGEAVQTPSAEEYAAQLGWNTSYDLPAQPIPSTEDQSGDVAPRLTDYDGRLPVLHYIDRLNAISRNIADAAKTAIEESGANMLYLTFGFLEWYESDDSEEPHLAPLITLPVTIDRTPGKGKAFRCELEFSYEEGIETNLSLVEKMRRDLGLDIPFIAEGDSPEQYFARFADLLSIKKRWKIRRYLVLSLLDFGKFLMFRDMDSKNWPAEANISTHPLVQELFEGTREVETGRAEEFPIDDAALQEELPPLIRDADSSQHSALIDALRGKNVVIQGPPGTGKSQTITNLIAEAIARGKTVLFVAEKLAALQVVRDRMDECGLGPFCLELHSHKTKKGELLKDIARRIDLIGSLADPANIAAAISVAESRKKRLAEYIALIKHVVQPIEMKVFDILWARESAFQSLPFSDHLVSNINPAQLLQYTQTNVAEAKDWLAIFEQNVSDIIKEYGKIDEHPWFWIQKGMSYAEEQSCFDLLPQIVDGIDQALAIAEELTAVPNPAVAAIPMVKNDASKSTNKWTVERVGCLFRAFRLLDSAPLDALDLRSKSLESKEAVHYLRETGEKARRLQGQRTELASRFGLNSGSPDEQSRHASALEQTPWFMRLFSRDYREAVRAYKEMATDHRRATRTAMASGFRSVASYHLQRIAFDKNATHHERIGVGFTGIDSKWDRLVRLGDWYEKVLAALPDGDTLAVALRAELFGADVESLRSAKDDKTNEHDLARAGCTKLELLAKRLVETKSAFSPEHIAVGTAPMETIRPVVEQFNFVLDTAFGEIAESFGDATDDYKLLARTTRLLAAFASASQLACAEKLVSPEYERYLADVRSRLVQLEDAIRCLAPHVEKLAEIANNEVLRSRAATFMTCWRDMATKALDNPEALQTWVNFVRCRNDGDQHGLNPLTTLLEDGAIKPEQSSAAFRFILFNTLAKNVMSQNPALWEFSGQNHEEVRKQFARADKEVIRLQRQRAAARTANREVPHGNKSGSVKTWTELAMLQWQINKQKGHLPIRQIVHGAGAALRALKPCFMMGPQSVAKYLPPGHAPFDIVVMDEASQIRPEDAIGAMARARQSIIVGDVMQLPPTSFFNRTTVASDGDGDGDGIAALPSDSESILDVAASIYSSRRRLRWHYRSQHESLIAFSNQQFYDSDLVIFPAALNKSDSLGVKYHFISNAVYENRCNRREADAVVEAVLRHMRTCPNESLGVVAMNAEQRDLIEGLLEELLHEDPDAQAFRSVMVGTRAFFVKNLENVQGDERDVMFISTTYGPDQAGNQFQRFGPVNAEAGHRRLNVLFTRAKLRTVIFTSLDTAKILAGAESSRGLRAFKGYLTYARTGILDDTAAKDHLPDNDFERSVKSVLESRNLEVVSQVGEAGFFIDLGVKNPIRPGEYLLGVECDGAMYHSSRSARDRDRLREEILRSRGWTLHRIWSTDWFKNRNREIEKMFKRIEAVMVAQK
jgi:hypothetical protein